MISFWQYGRERGKIMEGQGRFVCHEWSSQNEKENNDFLDSYIENTQNF